MYGLRSVFSSSLLRYSPARVPALLRPLSAAVQDASATQSISKDALLKLRKKTGYSFVNCRKALVQCGEDNMEDAEKWLKEVAKKEGWAKAAKLVNRETGQGMCGVLSEGNVAAVIELNCETDFVANNQNFKELVVELTRLVLDQGKSVASSEAPADSNFKVVNVDLSAVKTSDGSSVQELITATIGKLGENISLAKAIAIVGRSDVTLFGSAHPRDGADNVKMGRFVAVVSLKRSVENSGFPTETLGDQICQHVIGLNPQSLGNKSAGNEATEEADTVDQNNAEEVEHSKSEESSKDELNDFDVVESPKVDEDEDQLLHQAFMLNPRHSVATYLQTHGAEVNAFVRFELGKEIGSG